MPLDFHRRNRGKIKVEGKVPLETDEDLSLAYTPGVAEPVKEIQEDPEKVYNHTVKGEMAAVVSDGSAVLGLGDVGPEAAIPVMEGKALLIRELGGVSAFPLVFDEESEEELVDTIERSHPMFGFMMLEDIESPKCFRMEDELKERLEIPVFHDDQHGAAVAILAGLENALEVVGKDMGSVEVTILGAGAAGIATSELLVEAGVESINLVDRPGILHSGIEEINDVQREAAERVNPGKEEGDLEEAMEGSDVVIGVAAGGIISREMVESMAEDAVVFALSNPEPEIDPEDARDAGAAVVGTGRSDYPNQINNVLAFPGIVKGCLQCYASDINTEMKIAAAEAIASRVPEPTKGNILPSALDRGVASAVAQAVVETGEETGACRPLFDD